MTKAEAIAMLKRIQEPEAWEPQINQAAFEALDMAIKALEQQYLNQTDQYNAGYNAAKREIALSGEYERAYERGKADAHPDINDEKLSEIPTGSEREE